MELLQLELFYLNLDVSNILITPIKIDGTHYCLQDEGLTVPILGGNMPSSTTPLMPNTVSGDNVFNVYQAVGSAPRYSTSRKSGSIKFGVHPCAEKIDIDVVGRADIYGSGFDTLDITIDGSQVAFFQSITTDPPTPFTPPLDQVEEYNETVTHTFTTDIPCGHIVEIFGESGSVANNDVGYDVKITVTLP